MFDSASLLNGYKNATKEFDSKAGMHIIFYQDLATAKCLILLLC